MNGASVRRAAAIITAGGIVAYPTEACFGLGCDPRNSATVRRLLALKRRAGRMGLVVLAADLGQLDPYLAPHAAALLAAPLASWPGPHTWLLPVRSTVSPAVRGGHTTIAVRITAHPPARALARAARRAIISTSANRHGRDPARNRARVEHEFGAELDYILDGPLGAQARPTAIRDAATGAVLRAA